jgi:arylsulfatase A-like enzyme
MDVHAPYAPPPSTKGRFCRGHRLEHADAFLESRFRAGKHEGDAAVLEHVIELYDEDLLAADAALGEFISSLEKAGLTETTHVVVASDHGEEFYEHGATTHGENLYQETVRVPLIIVPATARRASIAERATDAPRASRVVRRRVGTIDLLPTILEMAGLSHPEGIEGESLIPLMSAAAEASPGVGEAQGRASARLLGSQLLKDGRAWSALFAGEDKLIRVRPPASEPSGSTRHEMYHLDRDPGERRDVAAAEHEQASALARILDGYEKVWGVAGSGRRQSGESVDRETLEQLKALGYIQ